MTPLFFLIDFEKQQPLILPLDQAAEQGIFFEILGTSNVDWQAKQNEPLQFTTDPLPFTHYQQGFDVVQKALHFGNSYLLNLTYPTPIQTNYDLRQIFTYTKAPYKLLLDNRFVCFSPECFVRIQNNKIYSYPMKGTISDNQPNAAQELLNSEKELCEHYTIVDLIRNDLSIVASHIQVEKFRYLEKIQRQNDAIWQTSSVISGELAENWRENLIELLFSLLPAGSISGAPKAKTVEIIQQAEQQPRGYYTGIFGIFDGNNVESAVIIRYIEQTETGLQFRSGGGITVHSDVYAEYQEMLAKVGLPIA